MWTAAKFIRLDGLYVWIHIGPFDFDLTVQRCNTKPDFIKGKLGSVYLCLTVCTHTLPAVRAHYDRNNVSYVVNVL